MPIVKLLERQRCHPFFFLFIYSKIIFVLLLLPYDFSDEVRALLGVSLPFWVTGTRRILTHEQHHCLHIYSANSIPLPHSLPEVSPSYHTDSDRQPMASLPVTQRHLVSVTGSSHVPSEHCRNEILSQANGSYVGHFIPRSSFEHGLSNECPLFPGGPRAPTHQNRGALQTTARLCRGLVGAGTLAHRGAATKYC